MNRNRASRVRTLGTAVAAAAVLGLLAPSAAADSGVPSSTTPTTTAAVATSQSGTQDVGARASWRTIDTYRTSVTCQAAKLQLELNTNWTLRCQAAGVFTHHLQRYH